MNRLPVTQISGVNLITCSFSGDLELCRLLCESIDEFVPASIAHTLYVPEADAPLFAAFANSRREIRSQESLLPSWFWKLPMPGPVWRKRLHLPRRNVYVTPYSLPVRGWIAQQIMKIAATVHSPSDVVVHIDSDNAFIRPMDLDRLIHGDSVRLYRNPQKVDEATHRTWHAAAGRLLGLSPSDFYGAEYIDQLVVWKRPVLLEMTQRIETVAGAPWPIALARTSQFAEYILYGVFADKVMGLDKAGLHADDRSLCLSRWDCAIESEQDAAAFIDDIGSGHVACLIQSTIAMSLQARRNLFERAKSRAAAQDRTVGSDRRVPA
ncbi:MAG: hypothetical protein KDJ29_02855 [Hyphomicrobiales bacterium]|nr:hypothetical protein [Hyphomicrobiales bacterium]